MGIFDYLYDEEIVRKTHEAHIEREAEARGRNDLMQEMLKKGFITSEQAEQLDQVH